MHVPAVVQPEKELIRTDPCFFKAVSDKCQPWRQKQSEEKLSAESSPGSGPGGPEGFIRESHRFHPVIASCFQNELQDGRMKVHVVVGVDVVQREAGFFESIELCADFRFQLPSHRPPEEEANSGKDKTRREAAPIVYQTWYFLSGEQWGSVYQYEMEPNFQPREHPGPLHGIPGGPCPYHQTGAAENPVAMGLFDRFIDRQRSTEVVSRDDQLLHDGAIRGAPCLHSPP